MPFDKEAESNEVEPLIRLVFESGHPVSESSLPMPPSAYIALGSFFSDHKGHPMLTTREMSFESLRAQVEDIKATLDARVAEAKMRFAASISNGNIT